VSDLWINVFITNMGLMNCFMIGNEDVSIKLTKRETTLVLNKRLNTKRSFGSGITMVASLNQVDNTIVESEIMIKSVFL
jgi:hypothetical protein